MTNLAIAASGLVKSFGKTRALNGLDLSVATGEVHGFLGPNGAGKTTTIRILLGLLRADAGQAQLLGGDPWGNATDLHRRLAYVPGDVVLWPSLTGGEVIDLLGRLRGRLDPVRKAKLLARFDLDPTKKCKNYSKGNRQKVAIIAALSSAVELLILDEPTSGLDPLMQAIFNDCILEAKKAGTTVLLSSHVLAEVQTLCDRISIIRHGALVESGTLSELRHLTLTSVSVETSQPLTGLATLAGVHDLSVVGAHATFRVDVRELDAVMRHLVPFGIRALSSTPATLEELFLRHYGDDIPLEDRDRQAVRAR